MSANQKARVQIARDTLAALEAGFYLAGDRRCELAEALADARADTALYELGRDRLDTAPDRAAPPTIEITDESTNDACIRLAAAGAEHLGALNFASARSPGGGFLTGAQAQEEAIARSSGLYPCLLEAPDHYTRNAASRSHLYLDLAIVSPRVPLFRTDDGGWLPAPIPTTILTCAAPNQGALVHHRRAADLDRLPTVLRRRARFVLALAAHHGVTDLVLGAWGCGVFRNDPELVAAAFDIDLLAAFSRVTFAIYGGGDNLDAFTARFQGRTTPPT